MKKNILKKVSYGIAMITICGMLVACTHSETAPVIDATPAPTPTTIVQQIEPDVEKDNLNNDVVELGAEDFHCEFDYLVYCFKTIEKVEKIEGDKLVLFYQQMADAGYSANIECDNEYLEGYKEFLELRNKVNEESKQEIVEEVEIEEAVDHVATDKIPDVAVYFARGYTEEERAIINDAVNEGKMSMEYIEEIYAEWDLDDFDKFMEEQIELYKEIKANTDDRPFPSAEETKESIKKHHGIG